MIITICLLSRLNQFEIPSQQTLKYIRCAIFSVHSAKTLTWPYHFPDKCKSNKCKSNKCKSNKCKSNKCKSNKCKSNKCKSNKCKSNKCKSNKCKSNKDFSAEHVMQLVVCRVT